MSSNCNHEHDFTGVSSRYKRILVVVIAINGLMFMLEMASGIAGQSQALKADALDFLADSATYAMSLWAIGQSAGTRSNVALVKGGSLLLIALWVLGSTIYHVVFASTPSAPIMGSVAVAALVANLVSVLLLLRYRDGDANVRSVWLCSRNDAIGNVAVMIAAVMVAITQTRWPDLFVAALLAALFSWSAVQIIRQAIAERTD